MLDGFFLRWHPPPTNINVKKQKLPCITCQFLFTLVGVRNKYETKYDSGPPEGERTCTKLYISVRYCTEEEGGVDRRRTATLRPAPPTLWEKNWNRGDKLNRKKPIGGPLSGDKYK